MITDKLFVLVDSCGSIEEIHDNFPELDFLTYLHSLIGYYRISTVDLLEKTTIRDNQLYQILDGLVYPTRNQILQLSFAIGIDFKKTNILLYLTRYRLLSHKEARDGFIVFALKQHYSLTTTNHYLKHCKLPIIE